MTTEDSLHRNVAYCGLSCGICVHLSRDCPGCRHGGGPDVCHQRACCVGAGLAGCWECESFPCENGFFADQAWSGLCIGCVRVIKTLGVPEFIHLLESRLGKVVDYGDYRFKSEEEVVESLSGEADA